MIEHGSPAGSTVTPLFTTGRGHLRLLVGGIVAGAAIVGLVLRLDSFTASLWLDEYSTLWTVEGSLREVLERVPQVMLQSPFGFVIVWLSVQLFGESEAALRLPSLLASVCAAGTLALGSRWLFGGKAAVWAFVLFWLCYPAVWTSVDARPYALALLFGSMATVGFLQAVSTGRNGARALWIAGASGLVWTHFVFVPYLTAHLAAYGLRRSMRSQYTIGRLMLDGVVMMCLVLPAAPQLAAMLTSPDSRGWLFQPRHLGLIAMLTPLLVPALLGPSRAASGERDARFALWTCVIVQLLALEGMGLADAPIVSRYAVVVVIPLVVLAAVNLSRISGLERILAVAWFAMATSLAFYANARLFGSPSGAGYQQWREAVQSIRVDALTRGRVPVLFRSGNAEDDSRLLGGAVWPASRAPLRAPGTSPPDWTVLTLTYRWAHPDRPKYFEESLAPRLAEEPVFYLLCLVSDEPGTLGYCADVRGWIETKWKDRVRATSLGRFSQVEAIRFERAAP